MITWIEFKTETGQKHPDSEALAISPLALLLLQLIRENEDVFGAYHPIKIHLCNSMNVAITHLSPDSVGT